MKEDPKVPSWFLWFSEHGVSLLLVLAIAGLAYLYVRGRSNTQQRLNAIEKTVQSAPPRAYTPPDVAEYEAKGVSADSLVVRRAIYVPVYSHIYYDGGRPYLLEATLSIRNTDIDNPIYLRSVRYYDTSGKLSKKFVDSLVTLGPLETIEFLVERRDATGGSGANFIVEWGASGRTVEPPFVEAVMVGRSGTNAISFVSPGRTLDAKQPE